MALDSFPRFNSLPAEIRHMIWTAGMVEKDVPVMRIFHYKHEFACSDPESTFPRDKHYVAVRSVPPAMFVNREARAAIEVWATRESLTLYLRPETGGHVYIRPWDEHRDVLYVARQDWRDFCDLAEPTTGMEERKDFICRNVRHLALPAFTVYYSCETIVGWLLESMPNIEKIYIVWGRQPWKRLEAKMADPPSRLGPDGRRYLDNGGGDLSQWDGETLDWMANGYTEEQRRISRLNWLRGPAVVQPRWEMEVEDKNEVIMELNMEDEEDGDVDVESRGRHTGHVLEETVDMAEMMFDLDQQLALSEWPDEYVDMETGEYMLEFVPRRAIGYREFDTLPMMR